jgi:NAD(P)-dependent dehydrogenase (short-subunit alcohol dehydrogenase family)
VLVTGAASGIGRAAAVRFAAEGASVTASDIDEDGVVAAVDEITAAGGIARGLVIDQSDESSIAGGLDAFIESGLDVVCVNAGMVLPLRSIESTPAEDWDRIFAVNLRGAFLLARGAVPLIRARGGGSIVFTASIAGMRGHAGSSSYAATKAGLLGLSRSLAYEVASDGIRVNAVNPGAVTSTMGGTLEELAPMAAINPLRRVALPEDVAAGICFLASDDARHVTAGELVIDGGISTQIALPPS